MAALVTANLLVSSFARSLGGSVDDVDDDDDDTPAVRFIAKSRPVVTRRATGLFTD